MSFGFSVSDIILCARLAYKLYDEFKQASGACQEFAQELLLFHQVLLKTKSTFECQSISLKDSDLAALGACIKSCAELLYVQIMGAHPVPGILEGLEYKTRTEYFFHSSGLLQDWRKRYEERKFASRIPKLQRAIL